MNEGAARWLAAIAIFLAGLSALAEGIPVPNVHTGMVAPGRTALVFPGQRSQWATRAVQVSRPCRIRFK